MKLLAFTLTVVLLALPIVTFGPAIPEQTAEAGGVHHFWDHHWDRAIGYVSYFRIHTRWHWHFFRPHPNIERHFHWRHYNNAWWTNKDYYWPNHTRVFTGRGWPKWAEMDYINDRNAIHKTRRYGLVHRMVPEEKWFRGPWP